MKTRFPGGTIDVLRDDGFFAVTCLANDAELATDRSFATLGSVVAEDDAHFKRLTAASVGGEVDFFDRDFAAC